MTSASSLLIINVALGPQRPFGLSRTSTSSFTQLLSSDPKTSSSVMIYVHWDRADYQGRVAQDVHLDFHTDPEL